MSPCTTAYQNSDWSQNSQNGQNASDGERLSIEEARRASESVQTRIAEARSLTEAESALRSTGVEGNSQLSQIVYGALRDSGLSASEASRIMNAKDFDALAEQRGVLEEVLGEVASSYRVGGRPNVSLDGMVPPSAGWRPSMPAGSRREDMASANERRYQEERDRIDPDGQLRDRRSSVEGSVDGVAADRNSLRGDVRHELNQSPGSRTVRRGEEIVSDAVDAVREAAPGAVRRAGEAVSGGPWCNATMEVV